MSAPICPICNQPGSYYPSSAQFHRGVDYGPVWACLPCDTRVTAKLTGEPKGLLACPETRRLRRACHRIFDPICVQVARRDGLPLSVARQRGYTWLAGRLSVEEPKAHFGAMQAEELLRALAVLRSLLTLP